MLDVIIAGAGPAGSLAAVLLARTGARVLIVDRDRFPRDKLCGDTLNPGGVRLLESLGLGSVLERGLPLRGMCVTGPGATVVARYPAPQVGRSLARRDLDSWLLGEAIRAGAHVEENRTALRPLIDVSQGGLVRGLVLSRRGSGAELRIPASVTIAADGRHSRIARSMGLLRAARSPRRWAFGTYASGVVGLGDVGEMHIRPGWYVGIAQVPGGLANVCVVRSFASIRPGTPAREVIHEAIRSDGALAERFAAARFQHPVRVLGPLASDVRSPGMRGLLLAGDASGFVDPMTGDGLTIALRGAMLVASEVLQVLETGDFSGAVQRLASARRRTLGMKTRFNKLLRGLVASPMALETTSVAARLFPGFVSQAVRYAGDAS